VYDTSLRAEMQPPDVRFDWWRLNSVDGEGKEQKGETPSVGSSPRVTDSMPTKLDAQNAMLPPKNTVGLGWMFAAGVST